MECNIEKECSALGALFQTIVNDMKGSTPIWEDFTAKATKLHTTLRATIVATGAFLEAFQKVADMATNTRGATREMGSALTRLCMRHRSIEGKLKQFTGGIMDFMVMPLQERLEDWKKTCVQLDKEHTKEYKRAKQEIKRASTDTVRLQKKVRKGKADMQNRLDNAMHDVNEKFLSLEETEKNSVRTALIEERSRFCHFITCLKPVVDAEIGMLNEVTHLQEIIESLCMQASEPGTLPAASEQVIQDLKGSDPQTWQFHLKDKSPPSSPSSLGSRKSSMCSISSINSSSSGSSKSHSPSHHFRARAASQRGLFRSRHHSLREPMTGPIRLSSVSSQDSGFTSQDTLFLKPSSTPPLDANRKKALQEGVAAGGDSNSTTPSPSYPGVNSTSASTWSNWPELPGGHQKRQDPVMNMDRPHTISSAYERTHSRPALSVHTFEPPEHLRDHPPIQTAPTSPSPYAVPCIVPPKQAREQGIYESLKNLEASKIYDTTIYDRPPSLGPKPKGKAVAPPTVPDFMHPAPDQITPQPMYVNMNELATLAVQKQKEVERHRLRQLISEPADMSEHHARSAHQPDPQRRCQRSTSLPAKEDLEYSPLSRVIEELNQHTAALRSSRSASPKRAAIEAKAPNSQELADAIKELEERTAALQMNYDTDSQSLQSHSSGYSTASEAALSSEGTSSGEYMELSTLWEVGPHVEPPPEQYCTLPRHTRGHAAATRRPLSMSAIKPPKRVNSFKPPLPPKRSVSVHGIPGLTPGAATIRRGSLGSKPAPPIRRSSSISGAVPVSLPIVPTLDSNGDSQQPRSGSTTPTPQGTPGRHRRTMSDIGLPSQDCVDDTISIANEVTQLDPFDAGHVEYDLPPPPPELLNPSEEELTSSSDSASSLRRIGSVTDTHADFINNLNAKLANPLMPHMQRPMHLTGATSPQPSTNRYSSHSSDDATPTAESPNMEGMLQMNRGMPYIKTISNDRTSSEV